MRTHDLVIHGASGFTGRLVAEYLAETADPSLRWALSGRDLDKLAVVRDAIGASATMPLIRADADDPESLAALAGSTRLVLTTVGPYQLYGSGLVAACAAAGTDYVDLCGEPAWMRAMIDAHGAAAKASGARILFSCGFDSIPFDLGVLMLQQAAERRFGQPAQRVKGRVARMKGGASGGTLASMRATMAAAAKSLDVLRLMKDPFALTPGFAGPHQPSGMLPEYDMDAGVWAVPFVMATINTKNVHRTNALLGHPWGTDFAYDEMLYTTLGEAAKATAEAIAKANPFGDSQLKPGEGPGKAEREAGFYEVRFLGRTAAGDGLRLTVTGDRDPGYGSTSRMIAETALCLLTDRPDAAPGIATPGAALGAVLAERLQARAGLRFLEE
ncbi:saccharopine dehydrogenase family protein [Sphingomonas sanxanigenens]|uniref:Saccharopine dehydrogenase NADP binding domain-containing protein n=1 Tax=Sphingomonas sanxanigenens DSM 19645 = NX02 TaxID=1123269 RepID=W0AB81_9SPHN|nr:saccharopine dehydrogenase NADP-binding domain-containing protein [Sphingomonas sanxanigenens]AHE52925.1 hypothetical protein NX02_05950 [Sphingomonas sanxanigenens DSM 19645 = NX02]